MFVFMFDDDECILMSMPHTFSRDVLCMQAAFAALSSTHLYGRKLVVEWSDKDEEDLDVLRGKAEERMEDMGRKKSSGNGKSMIFDDDDEL